MDKSSGNKQFSRRKRKEKLQKTIAGTHLGEKNEEKKVSAEHGFNLATNASSLRTSSDLSHKHSADDDIPNCSQFIEHEPVVEWGSPQDSPNSFHDPRIRTELVTPPQIRGRRNLTAVQKPVRKLIKPTDSPTQFLKELMALSEKYKDKEDSEVNECTNDEVVLKDASLSNIFDGDEPKQSSKKKQPVSAIHDTIVKDDYGMLLEDDEDDIIVQCTQQFEETSGLLKSAPEKIVTPKDNKKTLSIEPCEKVGKQAFCQVKQSVHKSPRSRTPNHARYYFKDGKLIGRGPRKSPRTKKNILTSLNQEAESELCSESFERALQSIVTEDSAFSETFVDNNLTKSNAHLGNNSAKISDKGLSKTKPVRFGPLADGYLTRPLQEFNSKKVTSSYYHRAKCENSLESLGSKISTKPTSPLLKCTPLDDDVNESELLNVLEVVESQAVSCSPPFQCTPEEIQKKRIEAKHRLAKKKLASKNKQSKPVIIKPKR